MIESIDRNYGILVADPDSGTCLDVRNALADYGHRVVSCNDGDQAWKQIESGPPDLVLLDLALPGIDGFDIIARCRESEALEDLPIIALSESTTDEVCDRALSIGASAFVGKPLSMPLLAHTVWQVVRCRARDEELRKLRQFVATFRGATRSGALDTATG